jgi:hypothetical protein
MRSAVSSSSPHLRCAQNNRKSAANASALGKKPLINPQASTLKRLQRFVF